MSDRLFNCRLCGASDPKSTETVNVSRVTCTGCGLNVNQTSIGAGDARARWNKLMCQPLTTAKANRYYRLGGQIDDIVGGHVLQDTREVLWDSIEQKWSEV